jgi:hypothetical protein
MGCRISQSTAPESNLPCAAGRCGSGLDSVARHSIPIKIIFTLFGKIHSKKTIFCSLSVHGMITRKPGAERQTRPEGQQKVSSSDESRKTWLRFGSINRRTLQNHATICRIEQGESSTWHSGPSLRERRSISTFPKSLCCSELSAPRANLPGILRSNQKSGVSF